MRVAVMMVVRTTNRHHAAGARYGAADVLKLHSGVVDVETVPQHMFQRVENAVTL